MSVSKNTFPVAVDFESLELLLGSGLTDRRFRQLAEEGWFPKKVNGKYNLAETIRGYCKYLEDTDEDLKCIKQKIEDEKHRKIKRENDLSDELLVEMSAVVSEFRKVAEPIKALLRQKLENEYPLAVAGIDVPQARIYGKRLGDDILREWQKLFDRFGI